MPLTSRERVEAGWLVLSVAGEVDIYAAPALRAVAVGVLDRLFADRRGGTGQDRQLDAPGEALRGIVLDLGEVSFMDSAGLGVVVWMYRRARSEQCPMRLCSTSPQLERLFTLTGVATVLPSHPSVAAARGGADEAEDPQGR